MSTPTPSLPTETRLIIPRWLKGKRGGLGLIFIVYILFNLTWTYFHWGGPQHVTLIANLFSFTSSLMASILAWRVVAQKSLNVAIRRAWLMSALCQYAARGNLLRGAAGSGPEWIMKNWVETGWGVE